MKINLGDIFDRELKKQLVQISIISFIFLVIILIKPHMSGKYIVNDKGNVVGIMQRGTEKFAEYNLIANVQRDNKSISQDVSLRKNVDENNGKENHNSSHDIEAEMSASLGIAVSRLEESRSKKIILSLGVKVESLIEAGCWLSLCMY